MGDVNITIASGGLGGTIQTNDGVVGMVLTGVPDTGGYAVGTPIKITSLAGLALAGITKDSNEFAYRQVFEFYAQAGEGAVLYLLLAADTLLIKDICDIGGGVSTLMDYANGAIRVIGAMTNDDLCYTEPPSKTSGITNDIQDAMNRLQTNLQAYFVAKRPARGIIGGTSYELSDFDGALVINSGTSNDRVGLLYGDTQQNSQCSALGLMLGRVASIRVSEKISKVRLGKLTAQAIYYGATLFENTGTTPADIAHSGYITFTTYPNIAGYFFSGDSMATDSAGDYAMLCRGRIIDKATILAYKTYVQEIDDDVLINADGTLDAGFCKWLSQQVVNQINNTMKVNGEVSNAECIIDPAQNILANNDLKMKIRVTPVAYLTTIDIELSLVNPAS